MHGNLEPEENVWPNLGKEHVNDLWEDMDRLNALYEELMWHHDDVLDMVADFDGDRIIITNKCKKGR